MIMYRKISLGVAAALLLAGLGFYQLRPAAANTDTPNCFQSGSSATFTRACISSHGNVSSFESPQTKEHIRAGVIGEGYAICSNNGSTVHGWDAGHAESSWGATTSAAGPVITRSTSDGAFKIKQSYAFNGPETELRITMAVTNTSGSSKSNVLLSRYFDGDVDSTGSERGALTSASVFEWLEFPGHGLKLTASTFATQHRGSVESFGNWAGGTEQGCTPNALTTPAGPTDLTGRMNYLLGSIANGATKTVVYTYERL